MNDSVRLHRDTLMMELDTNRYYIEIIKEKKIEASYIQLISIINDGIITSDPKGFSIPFLKLENTNKEQRNFCYSMVLLNSCGGYTKEQVETFERYKNMYGYFSIDERIFYNDITHTEENVPKFNLLPIFSILDPNNKTIANGIYKMISQGYYNWENKNSKLFYPYLSNRKAYNEYLKKVDPHSPYIYDFETTAEQISAAYDANEVTANKICKNKRLRLTGRVISINEDFSGNAFAVISGGNSLINVHCIIPNKDKASKLRKGNRYSITGVCMGMNLNFIVLDNCDVE